MFQPNAPAFLWAAEISTEKVYPVLASMNHLYHVREHDGEETHGACSRTSQQNHCLHVKHSHNTAFCVAGIAKGVQRLLRTVVTVWGGIRAGY